MSTGPHRRLTVGSGVDDDVVVALVLHDNAVEIRKGGRVGHNIEGVLSVADGVWQGQRCAQEVGHVGGGSYKAALEGLSTCHAWWVVDQVSVLVEKSLNSSRAVRGIGKV